jgi:hypothetical protein
MDWYACDRYKRRALVNVVTNLRIQIQLKLNITAAVHKYELHSNRFVSQDRNTQHDEHSLWSSFTQIRLRGE